MQLSQPYNSLTYGNIQASTSKTGPTETGGTATYTASGNSKLATYAAPKSESDKIYALIGKSSSRTKYSK